MSESPILHIADKNNSPFTLSEMNGTGDKKKTEYSQATSQANACGNGFLAENVFVKTLAHKFKAMKT